jgi:hypothetical protein
MNHAELIDLLVGAGFDGGWVLAGEVLVLWQHEQDPPLPLVRPAEQVIDDAE